MDRYTTFPTLAGVDIPELGEKRQGKVRDFYTLPGQRRALITTDRLSAFDRVVGLIPHKGQVLNQLAAFWFEQTGDIIPNHMLAVPDPNVMIGREAQAFPVEIVVRGYISGVTKTSLWYNYQQGEREIYGLRFPEGLHKNQRLPDPVITPTTRATGAGGHDERITRAEIIERGLVAATQYRQIEQAALALFKRGQQLSEQGGLILVDTKYEFGLVDGQVILIDEMHTPDSSRFWRAETYRERLAAGLEPENFDKEFIRLWFAQQNYRGDGEPPALDSATVSQASRRYVSVYEMLTGRTFVPGETPYADRIRRNLLGFLQGS
ncbi:MAG: phosphoribosylaminoimidazolesuccinocarboxamide synthase [Chloroflexi bacterium]|nr:phosphoribosylaminoimidazolesuccinocarboxamide synthase [Chloroflexota bacterium]